MRVDILQDEQGKFSSARCSFWLSLVFTLSMVAVDVFTARVVPGEAYALLGTIVMFTVSWAAGGRISQYLAPAISGATQAISAAVKRRIDNRFEDDERAEPERR